LEKSISSIDNIFGQLFLCERTIHKVFSAWKIFAKTYILVTNISNNVSLLVNVLNCATGCRLCCSVQLLLLKQGKGIPQDCAVDQQVMFVFTQVHIYSKQGRRGPLQTRMRRLKAKP
jgi:hypothetical protein